MSPVMALAPDIAGQDIANPLATILSLSMMLLHSLNTPKAAVAIEESVKNVLVGYRTKDIVTGASGEKIVGCKAMGEAVLDALI